MLQHCSSPCRQMRHEPQPRPPHTATASPRRMLVTSGPTASTYPAFSWPSVSGRSKPGGSGNSPLRMCRSEWQTPAPAIRISTSSRATTGVVTSSIRTGWLEGRLGLPILRNDPAVEGDLHQVAPREHREAAERAGPRPENGPGVRGPYQQGNRGDRPETEDAGGHP